MSVRGTVHARAYLHNNKPRAKLAEKVTNMYCISETVHATEIREILDNLRCILFNSC